MSAAQSELQQLEQSWIRQSKNVAASIVRPPPKQNAGQWADEHRVLPQESPEPGRWRTSRIPFWAPIYAAFTNPLLQLITICCGAQMGKTESVFKLMAHRLDQGPYSPVLYIGPTEKFVKAMAADRWRKLLSSTPRLWAKTGKGQLYKTSEQFVGGIRIGWAWAGSASEIAGHPAGMVMVDERSRMLADVGGEGDPVSLARARTKNYPFRKIGVLSTPTLFDNDPTWTLLKTGTVWLWAWECLHCGETFVPSLILLRWPDGATGFDAMDNARVHCPHCGADHSESDKRTLNANGFYLQAMEKPDTVSAENAILGELSLVDARQRYHREVPALGPTAGFWISGLASPWATWGDVTEVMIGAYHSGDQERIQAEVNTWGGEPFRIRGEAPPWDAIFNLQLPYARGFIPLWVKILTLGADVQKQGIYYVVRGWGAKAQSILIDDAYLEGRTDFDDVWIKMADILQGDYRGMPQHCHRLPGPPSLSRTSDLPRPFWSLLGASGIPSDRVVV